MTLSLAGRTAAPARQPVPVRRGGFGGAAGLADYLPREHVDALIDATHPYAATSRPMLRAAARQTDMPFIALRRPPWSAVAGDRWTEVQRCGAAVRALGATPPPRLCRAGPQEIAPFARRPQHSYLIRSVDPVDPPLPLPHASYITARGPFGEADERALLRAHRHRGGGREEQRRRRDLRQDRRRARARHRGDHVAPAAGCPMRRAVETVEEAIAWLDHVLTSAAARGV